MNKRIRWQYLILAAAAALGAFLAGCSGSSGNGSASSDTLSGVAATGAPMVGQVTLKDANAATRSATLAANGRYNMDVSGLKPPFLLQATAGNGVKHYSFAGGPGWANINPLSSVIVANAAGVPDPATVYSSADQAMLSKLTTNLPTAIGAVRSRLAPLLNSYGAGAADPIRNYYEANHQGLDGMFDDTDIQIVGGVIKIKNRKDNSEFFSGNVNDDQNDSLDDTKSPKPTGVATAPTGVTVTAGDAQNTITWPAVTGATRYNLYWSKTSGVTRANGTKIENVTSPYAHTGLTNGTAYYYILTAVNSAGESAASAQATATPAAGGGQNTGAAPTAPTLTATAGSAQNSITWPAVTGATSYDLYWSTTSGVTTANGTKIAGVTSPYTHTALTAGTPYYYILTATNATGTSPASAQATATPTAAAPAPDGAALYAQNCQGCHGALATTNKRGRSAAQIHAAIVNNIGGMGSLSFLTPAQESAIAVALGGAP